MTNKGTLKFLLSLLSFYGRFHGILTSKSSDWPSNTLRLCRLFKFLPLSSTDKYSHLDQMFEVKQQILERQLRKLRLKFLLERGLKQQSFCLSAENTCLFVDMYMYINLFVVCLFIFTVSGFLPLFLGLSSTRSHDCLFFCLCSSLWRFTVCLFLTVTVCLFSFIRLCIFSLSLSFIHLLSSLLFPCSTVNFVCLLHFVYRTWVVSWAC